MTRARHPTFNSRLGDLIDTAVDHNIIGKSGSWFAYGSERIGQGRDAVKKYLQDNEKIAKEIDLQLRKKLGLIDEDVAPKHAKGEAAAAKQTDGVKKPVKT